MGTEDTRLYDDVYYILPVCPREPAGQVAEQARWLAESLHRDAELTRSCFNLFPEIPHLMRTSRGHRVLALEYVKHSTLQNSHIDIGLLVSPLYLPVCCYLWEDLPQHIGNDVDEGVRVCL